MIIGFMETINQIRSLHETVQNNMFRILTEFDVLSQVASTCPTRLPLYFLSENQKFLFFEIESMVKPHVDTIARLLETGYLKIVCEATGCFLFFIKSNDYEKLTKEEKDYLTEIPEQNFIGLFKSGKHLSFLDEIL